MNTAVTRLFDIEYPVVAGGMVWCSGWRLAAAVSRAGGLGLIGAGSMHPGVLREHIIKCREACQGKPFGVNLPLFYPEPSEVINVMLEENVRIVFTSGGSPALYTAKFKEYGLTVVHVVASARFAAKAVAAGVDAVVAEGFEAGGHNGREEITTMALIPQVRSMLPPGMPLMAAGGIATGRGMLAALALGADGVQIGTRFALSAESSAHPDFKARCLALDEGGTDLCLKKIGAVRLVKNEFYSRVAEAEARGASAEELREILGSRRSKRGIFDGDLVEGELEIGQVASLVDRIEPAADIMNNLIAEFNEASRGLCELTR